MRWSRDYLLASAAALCVLLAAGLGQPRFLDDLGNFVFDTFQRLAPRPFDPDGPVRIVVVDEASLAAFGQWPWPRTRIAEITRKLAALEPAVIAFDIIFGEADRTSLEHVVQTMPEGPARDSVEKLVPGLETNDAALAAALAEAPAVLGATLLSSGDTSALSPKAGFVTAGDPPLAFVASYPASAAPIEALAAAAKGIGATNWLPDRDQVMRRVPLVVAMQDTLVPSLALESLRVAQQASTFIVRSSNASGENAFGRQSGINTIKAGDLEISTGAHADVRPLYSKANAERFIPVQRLLDGGVEQSEIEGRIVLVGTSAVGLGDVRATPLDASVPGVEIQAQIIEALATGSLLSRPDWAPGAEFALALVLFLIVAAALPAIPPIVSSLAASALVIVLSVVAFACFAQFHLLIDPAFPAIGTLAAYFGGTLALWRTERLTRQRVRHAFGKFLPEVVVDYLAEHPQRLVLGGETRELTVMFSDLRNFSGLSEGLGAQELTAFMNAYLTPMTDAILDHQGTVDKYIGDAIVAFWNAPLDIDGHPALAMQAALAMRSELARFNAAREAAAKALGKPWLPAAMGIGLNIGPCTVGNMGSVRRFDYSILGDTANLASRLEGVSKLYGVDIIASASVRARAPDLAWLELDQVRVKGRMEPTTIFTAVGDEHFASNEEFLRWRDAHDIMLNDYRGAKFESAAARARLIAASVPDFWKKPYEIAESYYRSLLLTAAKSAFDPIRVLENK